MQLPFLLMVLTSSIFFVGAYEDVALEDDDFADFEQFDVEEDIVENDKTKLENSHNVPKEKQSSSREQTEQTKAEDEIVVEDEDNEFEHFQDPEEFEGFQDSLPRDTEQPKITITKVPMIMRPRWDAYWLEGLLCCALAAYALAYVVGRAKNTSIAINFLKLHKPLLDENFTLVGESGADTVCAEEEGGGAGWRREAEHCFSMWCSGRANCDGLLLTFKLLKRQDLVHTLVGLVRPATDSLVIRVELGRDDGDPFVLCVAHKKVAARLARDMHDLSLYCGERRAGDKHGLPPTLSVLSECAEAAAGVLDSRVLAALNQYHSHLQYIHISDRYSGPKQIEEATTSKPPETERVLLAALSLGPDGGGEEVRPLLQLVLYLIDKVKRLRLSKEALSKCEKRRQKAAEAWVRGAHAARQEQAAQRREERRKIEKERILAEDDPEKQRRWELKEQKRQLKRKTPKMKQLKVKAL